MNKNGFTLIEFVISFGIAIIILGVSAVSFVSAERQKIIQSANVLQKNLRYCQKNAMDEKRKYDLLIDKTRNLYYIRRIDDYGLLRKISQVNLPSGINISTNAKGNSIAYTLQGTSSNACTIILRGRKYFLEMTVNVGSGRIKINQLQKLLG